MKIIHFETIDSTNLYLKNHYQELDNLTFVSADYQTNGKGRNERKWLSEKGDNLLFSLLIKDKKIIDEVNTLSLVAAISISQTLEDILNIKDVYIKWPNDIFIKGKKVCGILLEGQIPEYVVVGIGLNVNQKMFEGEYNHEPTSLYLELGNNVDISKLKQDLLDYLIKNINKISESKSHFYDYFVKHNYLKDKEISFVYNGKKMNGKVSDIDKDFRLVVDTTEGIMTLTSGEVSLLKI